MLLHSSLLTIACCAPATASEPNYGFWLMATYVMPVADQKQTELMVATRTYRLTSFYFAKHFRNSAYSAEQDGNVWKRLAKTLGGEKCSSNCRIHPKKTLHSTDLQADWYVLGF